jgi:hypothetical protein
MPRTPYAVRPIGRASSREADRHAVARADDEILLPSVSATAISGSSSSI